MDIALFGDIITFFQNSPIAALAAALFILFLAYKKPKMFFTLLLLTLVIIGVFYLITYVSDVGTTHKKTMIKQKDEPF